MDLQDLIQATEEIGMCLKRMLDLCVGVQKHMEGRPLLTRGVVVSC